MRSTIRIVRKACRLDRRARLHALRALGWLVAMRAALSSLPYATVRKLADTIEPGPGHTRGMTPSECARAIARASRVLPGTRCLARALAAECLLRRDGRHASVSLGARFDEGGVLCAHAWLECEGVPVTGLPAAQGYAPLGPPRRP